MKVAKPLQTMSGVHKCKPEEDVGFYKGKRSIRTFHIFVNSLDEPVDLYYFYDGGEMLRGSIEPGSNLYVGTYTFHQWKVKRRGDGAMLGLYAGQSAIVTIHKSGCTATYNAGTVDWRDMGDADCTSIDTPHGPYAVRGTVQGMQIWALQCVSEAAVERLKVLVNCMLASCPAGVLDRMLKHQPSFGIFGRDHVVSDIPPHAFMRFNTNRDLDKSSRGLGATPTVPVTSCGEENLTMDDDGFYPCQSIFVHEFGHAVMNLGMTPDTRQRLQEAYQAAVDEGIYPKDAYIIVNEHEYFATATEAWFESTIRKDVNGGLNTRALVKSRDPRLASIMAEMFGDGSWRFHHNCPRPLSFYRSTQMPQAEKSAHERERKAKQAALQSQSRSPMDAAPTSDTHPEQPDQRDQLEQLRAQLRAQNSIGEGMQQGQERYKQAYQQRQQQAQAQAREMQPPSAAELADARRAADAEAMSGPIGTGDPAGSSSLLSWLMPAFPCVPVFSPAKPPTHLPVPLQSQPAQADAEAQQPLLQLQQPSLPHHDPEQQQKRTKFEQEYAEWKVKYAEWEAECARKEAERAAWERECELHKQAQAKFEQEYREWEIRHGLRAPDGTSAPPQPKAQPAPTPAAHGAAASLTPQRAASAGAGAAPESGAGGSATVQAERAGAKTAAAAPPPSLLADSLAHIPFLSSCVTPRRGADASGSTKH